MEWISVEDRLPEQENGKLSQKCAVLFRGNPHIAQYEKSDNYHTWYFPNNDEWFIRVTHWMPLPNPPKEQDE